MNLTLAQGSARPFESLEAGKCLGKHGFFWGMRLHQGKFSANGEKTPVRRPADCRLSEDNLANLKAACGSSCHVFISERVEVVMRVFSQDDFTMMQWHLVLCKPNQHQVAERSLSRLDCEVFLPRQETRRHWRGRIIQELRPVFAGYLFVGTDPARPIWQPIRSAHGVSRIIGFGTQGPAMVPAQVVAGLMARCDADGVLRPFQEAFSVGDAIRIVSGPFADFVTQVDKIDPDRRLHVLLDLLGRPTRVVLDPALAMRRN